MAKDNAPVGYTCRTIDKIINLIKNLDLQEGQERDVSVIIDYIEEVRDSNERLREWGNELFDKSEQLENKTYTLQCKVEELESEINSLSESTI